MNAKKRYFLILFVSVVFCSAFVVYRKSTELWWLSKTKSEKSQYRNDSHAAETGGTFLDGHDEFSLDDVLDSPRARSTSERKSCTMESCFDKSRCDGDFKIYIYPIQRGEKLSPLYGKMIKILKESRYSTEDPSKACLFIPSLDTLDRDKLSEDYVGELNGKVTALPFWNGGQNHLIFNLFSGTWPDYLENLELDIGKAILAKASISMDFLRPHFDVSLPLFPKMHALRGGADMSGSVFPVERKYRLAFKGKRYVNGVGSESRNALYHIHNGKDTVLLTTCKHGKTWWKLKDARCDKDNAEYDKFDYDELLKNSTFCLSPRGRRLGSFRFLESLQVGCIPVILSNGWALPFAEVIDWDTALINGDERLLMQIPTIVQSYSKSQILAMRQQGYFLWNAYLSSVEKIVFTTLQVIRSRFLKSKAGGLITWNTQPGALTVSPNFSQDLHNFPFFNIKLGFNTMKFTAVIYATTSTIKESSPLSRLIKNVAQSKHVSKILVLWMSESPIAERWRWPQINIPLVTVRPDSKSLNSRFMPRPMIDTDAVLSLDEDMKLNPDEIDFAYSVWKTFPDRLVGFPSRSHYWSEGHSRWMYSSVLRNEYSMVLTSAAFYHRYYNHLYTNHLPQKLHRMVEHHSACEDLAMNFLISDVTKQPPVKILPHRYYRETPSKMTKFEKLFDIKQRCMGTLVEAFGYMPLMQSQVRMDPLLYRDPVSNLRKRYRLLEV